MIDVYNEVFKMIDTAKALRKAQVKIKQNKSQARVIANHALGFEETDGGT